MTLDEAIKRSEEVAEMKKTLSEESELQGCSMYAIRCEKSAEEHRQLAEWLRELKAYKEQESCEDVTGRKFKEIVAEYPPAELCTYAEYKGKPYFSIKYEENGEHFVGFGTYNPKALSRYLKEYFMTGTKIK